MSDDHKQHQQALSPMDNRTHKITESADKIRLKTKIKRGNGTRDQDEIEVKVKSDDPAEAVEKLHKTVELIGEKGTHETLRATQAQDSE